MIMMSYLDANGGIALNPYFVRATRKCFAEIADLVIRRVIPVTDISVLESRTVMEFVIKTNICPLKA